MKLARAIDLLAKAGVTFTVTDERRSFSLATVAARLDLSVAWVKDHIAEFPGRYRLPGGGENGGEWRIPARDLEAFEERRRLLK